MTRRRNWAGVLLLVITAAAMLWVVAIGAVTEPHKIAAAGATAGLLLFRALLEVL